MHHPISPADPNPGAHTGRRFAKANGSILSPQGSACDAPRSTANVEGGHPPAVEGQPRVGAQNWREGRRGAL